ncbi:MAG: cytochrome-c peroxidase [Stagnimonas sp.]|nr:cytochrome-c peroxidase [Stagnimonas sp.]
MNRRPRRWLALAALCALLCAAPANAEAPVFRDEPIRPVPAASTLNAAKVALGARLFADPLLSRDGSVSCASCHPLATGGTDHRPRSLGLNRAEGSVNAPTVLNSGLNFKQFWDGRADTLEQQVDGPLLSPVEMGSSWDTVIAKLRRAPGYAKAFSQAYPDGLSPAAVRNAIAEFERSLTTPNSRFDRYLRGEDAALSAAEKSGYRKFKAYGCISCHQGVNVGGNMFQRMGVMGDYFADRGGVGKADYGRYNLTGDEADRFTFKVPSLRNVELTAPYFHDGSAASLEQAVGIMAKYQLGRSLPPQDLDELVGFLKTLTGVRPGQAP